MCNVIFRILFLGTSFAAILGKNNDCTTENIANVYKFQCPPDNAAVPRVLIDTVPNKYVEMQCSNAVLEEPTFIYNYKYTISLLPNFNVGDIDTFQMVLCPLPMDSFSPTLKKLNISTVKNLKLRHYLPYENVTITNELFRGLFSLEQLELVSSPVKLDVNFLEHVPNLSKLRLEDNQIKEIKIMFGYTLNLQILQIIGNKITFLPEGAFSNLLNLQYLSLWNNEISAVDKSAFVGLSKLKCLDLSRNYLTTIEKDTFSGLLALEDINLRSNRISLITSEIFSDNREVLRTIRIDYNPGVGLSDTAFAHLNALGTISMNNCLLESLPEHIFKESYNLINVSIANNKIQQLPENIFKDTINMQNLDLSGNKLVYLPDKIFSSLGALKILNLEENHLSELQESLFKDLQNLRDLNLSGNRIEILPYTIFSNLENLEIFDMSHNLYNFDDVSQDSPFRSCKKLVKVDLSYNNINFIPEPLLEEKRNLTSLHLGHNKIEKLMVGSVMKGTSYENYYVYLNNNLIKIVDLKSIIYYDKLGVLNPVSFKAKIDISNNPIRCDCKNFDFVKYINNNYPKIRKQIDILLDNAICSTPQQYKRHSIKKLKPEDITCSIDEYVDAGKCPEMCECHRRPYDNTFVVNCAYKAISKPPKLEIKGDKLEVHLEGNALKLGPHEGLGYDNVIRLFLSNNQIRELTWVPRKIEELTLNGNQLRMLNSETIEIFNNLSTRPNLTLHDNPWSCDCEAIGFQHFIRNKTQMIKNHNIRCRSDDQLLLDVVLCKPDELLMVAIFVPILLILLAAALYYRFKYTIKMWLYVHDLCLWWVSEEEVDKDKQYDIFLAFSNKDEIFLKNNLLNILENGPRPFKVCVHVRDWKPGKLITTQITESVLDSRRTLIFLSNNFLDSEWAKLEFKTAQAQASNEGRPRVIAVKYGELDESKLSEELSTYLKMNTYVEWGDPWFWHKLIYALPHSKKRKYYNINKAQVPVASKNGSNLDLVTDLPIVHVESTPPISSLQSVFTY